MKVWSSNLPLLGGQSATQLCLLVLFILPAMMSVIVGPAMIQIMRALAKS